MSKFIVSLIPRVALIPSISEDSGSVLDYALVRSPAPNILVSYNPTKFIKFAFFIEYKHPFPDYSPLRQQTETLEY